jgi:hypothetical protein
MELVLSDAPNRVDASHLTMETDPVSETLCTLEYWTKEKVQKLSNPMCYTLSSEFFRINDNTW